MSLRVALVQLAVEISKTANIANAANKVREAAMKGAKLVVLPECFNSPYGTRYFKGYAEDVPTGETSQAMSAVAKECGVTVVAGTIPERGPNNKYYNTCAVYNEQGGIAGVYRKMHLYKLFTDQVRIDESEILAAGNQPLAVQLPNGFRIGVGICFDVRYPLLAAHYQHVEKTHMLVYPGAFNMVTGPPHWALTARARAVDCQQYIAMCGPARDVKARYVAWGHSLVCNPWGEVLTEADEKPTMVFADLSLDTIADVRKKLPITQEGRADLYAISWKEPQRQEQHASQ